MHCKEEIDALHDNIISCESIDKRLGHVLVRESIAACTEGFNKIQIVLAFMNMRE